MKHHKHPLEWDERGEWDGVVVQDVDGQWIRYRDRNGEIKDPVLRRTAYDGDSQ